LIEKAEILTPSRVSQLRQLLLNRYGDSEAAAQYRWKVALAKAAARLPRGVAMGAANRFATQKHSGS